MDLTGIAVFDAEGVAANDDGITGAGICVPGHGFAWFKNEPANEGVESFTEYFFFHDRLSLKY